MSGFKKLPKEQYCKVGPPSKRGAVDVAEGLLVDIRLNEKYPDSYEYVLEQPGETGDVLVVSGSTVLDRQVKAHHVGRLIRIAFLGIEQGESNEYWNIEVQVWDGDPPDQYVSFGHTKSMATKPKRVPREIKPPSGPLSWEEDDEVDEEGEDNLPF